MSRLDDSCFAYPALRRYPINTLESAKNSYGAYKVQRNSYDKDTQARIEEGFNKAAAFYGEALEDKIEPEQRTTLLFKGANHNVSMTEIENKDELAAAVDYILDKRASEPRANLVEAAKYVLWSASNTDIDMDSVKMRKIAHIAGIGVGDRDAIQHAIEKRAASLVQGSSDSEAMWKFARDVKSIPDDVLFKEENINELCNTLDEFDFRYNMHKKASDADYPENVCFGETLDDLLKEASDLYCIKSIDACLSKKATLERKDAINAFFDKYYGIKDLDGEDLINKVASLNSYEADALLNTLA